MSDEIKSLTQEDGQSKDLVKENVEKLKQLFPEIVTDGKVDFETLKEELGEFRETSDERYSFTWNGKGKARKLAMEPSRGTLRPAPEESINWDDTKHLFIEGDNLEVLKLLQRSYHKKVKVIYIDPPYNTGNDFVYSDDYKDNLKNYLNQTGQLNEDGEKISSNAEYSGRYHTDWLNMMYPRLKLARELLREDGVIFISVDDNEVANLRKMADEIFGEENFLANIIWEKVHTRKNSTKTFSTSHDYILAFARSKEDWDRLLLPRENTDAYTNPDDDPRGPWKADPITAHNYYAADYKIEKPNGVVLERPQDRYWVYSKENWEKKVENDEVLWGEGDSYPMVKRYLSDVQDGLVPVTLFDRKFAGDTSQAKGELTDLLGAGGVFDYPKPSSLIKRLLQISCRPGDIVLDFFAGSCPTAHACYNLNIQDEGDRKFIMVQLPEKTEEKSEAFNQGFSNIAEIGKERIRKTIEALKEENPDYEGDLGFKVFKLDSSNIKPWDPNFDEVQLSIEDSIENVKPDRSEYDLLYEILLKYGIDLSLPIEERTINGANLYIGGAGALVLCPSDNITLEVVEGIAEIKDEFQPEIMRVVFRDNGFKDDVVKTNAIQILKQHGIEDVKSI